MIAEIMNVPLGASFWSRDQGTWKCPTLKRDFTHLESDPGQGSAHHSPRANAPSLGFCMASEPRMIVLFLNG